MKEKITALIQAALAAAEKQGKLNLATLPLIELEKPKGKGHGDWSSNIALKLASKLHQPPQAIAELIVENIKPPNYLNKVEFAAPGFINFTLSNVWLYQSLAAVCHEQEKFGHIRKSQRKKVQIEFVSANPVGPMHVGHGRWAALGDTLARMLRAVGYEVSSEFYINDFGNQMNIFGRSVAIRYQQQLGVDVEFPADGYQGNYIIEIAKEIITADGDKYLDLSPAARIAIFTQRAYKQVLNDLKKILAAMNVHFDHWFSERWLHDSGYLKATITELKAEDRIYEKEGALWLRTSNFDDDKDRVLIRANGAPTYFAADIAYHRHKLARGYEKLIDIWGADHHGYVKRMQAALVMLGAAEDTLEIIIGQLVNLFSGTRQIRMSKRTGEMVTLEELLKEIGSDAARYFFLMRSPDTPLDFDIELAKSQTSDNPVYYVQYAHARICSILRKAADNNLKPNGAEANFELLNAEPELALIRIIAEWPLMLKQAAEKRRPHRLTQYAENLAANFHYFYHECRVISDNSQLTQARLSLVDCSRMMLKNVLNLMGISAPEKM